MTRDHRTIFMVGPMGSGKTTVGRRLANSLDYGFVDCDEEIEKRTGASVNLIFDIEGEAGFRARESRLLAELARLERTVVATGGGSVLREENRRLMADTGFVVWLCTSVDQQLRRLANDKKRPLLQAPDRRETLEALARERDPLYGEVADLVFQSANRSSALMARELLRTLREHLEDPEGKDPHAIH